MAIGERAKWGTFRKRITTSLNGPHLLAFLPAVTLAAFWIGGETALIATAMVVPIAWRIIGGGFRATPAPAAGAVGSQRTAPRHVFPERAQNVRDQAEQTGETAALFVIELDDFDELTQRYGATAAESVCTRTVDRLGSVVREADALSTLGPHHFGICLHAVERLDLEVCIQLAGRVQAALEEPISIDGTTIYVSASVGFCMLSRAPGKSGEDWIRAAEIALEDAKRRGPSSIRAYAPDMKRLAPPSSDLTRSVIDALEDGHIQPWFQPQISTDTGKVTGFEALARWSHPDKGMITPGDFLPAIEAAGKTERLAEVMLYHTMTAIKAWDAAGMSVPQVGVNFNGPELGNPRLIDKIKWELDRFDLTPDRLAIEILETVVASNADDTILHNLKGLGALGCRIDLDDFGTGNASIASIRRFSVSRIKIDRSFVMKADRDPDQQRMIAAILTMAERLGVETLAEGVETVGEHALLAQLGCNHVQGFGIGRPMPFDQTLDWIRRHEAKLQDAPAIPSRKSG